MRGVHIPNELQFFMPLWLTRIMSLQKYAPLCDQTLVFVLANQEWAYSCGVARILHVFENERHSAAICPLLVRHDENERLAAEWHAFFILVKTSATIVPYAHFWFASMRTGVSPQSDAYFSRLPMHVNPRGMKKLISSKSV